MFTGIIEELGEVVGWQRSGDAARLTVRLKSPGAGDHVNLERAAQLGDRLGGHIVQGHIDGTSTLMAITEGSAWRVLRFTLAADIAPLVTRKGSIAVDGVSLTVSAVSPPGEANAWFEVSLIPETLTATTLGRRAVGDAVNIETDILARQVERMFSFQQVGTSMNISNEGSEQ
jgi:riboflavin synthase